MEFHAFADMRQRLGRARARTGSGKVAGVGERQRAAATVRADRGGDQHRVAIGWAGLRPHKPRRCNGAGRPRQEQKRGGQASRRSGRRAARRRSRRGKRPSEAPTRASVPLRARSRRRAGETAFEKRQHRSISMRADENKTRTKASPSSLSARPRALASSIVAAPAARDRREAGIGRDRFRVEPGAGRLDRRLQPLGEGLAIEARGDRRQIFDHGDARPAREAAPAPEEAGVERDGKAGRAGFSVKRGDAELVARRRAGRAARALGIDEDLAARSQRPRAPGR